MLRPIPIDRDGSYRVTYPGGPVVHFKRPFGGRCRPLIISHSPSASDNCVLPLVGSRTGDKLARMIGLDHAGELGSVADLANLRALPTPGPDAKGDREAGERLLKLFGDGWIFPGKIIAVGHRVATALGFISTDPVYWATVEFGTRDNYDKPGKIFGATPLLVLPHTSTRNRWYNDPANQEMAREALAEIFNSPKAKI